VITPRTNMAPDKGPRRSKRPRFGYQATVEVWTETGPDKHPAALLQIEGWAWHRDQAYSAITHEARCALARMQVPLDVIKHAYMEPQVHAWWALDPKHVRNPDGEPVPAQYLVLDEDRAALIKQQRLVPEDWEHSNGLYLIPAAKPTEEVAA